MAFSCTVESTITRSSSAGLIALIPAAVSGIKLHSMADVRQQHVQRTPTQRHGIHVCAAQDS